MKKTTNLPEAYPPQYNAENFLAPARLASRTLRAAVCGSLALVLLGGCRRSDEGYLWPGPEAASPEEISYTVADFVAERNAGTCPAGKRLKFEGIELTGPNANNTYTMRQDGAASPEITFTLTEEPLDKKEAATIDTVTADISAQDCALTVVATMG